MPSAALITARAMATAFKPREKIRIDEWAVKYRRVESKDAPIPGPLDLSRTPYLIRPLRLFAHPLVREVTLQTATQVGKTELVLTIECAIPALMPGPTLVMFPTVEMGEEFNRDRTIPNIRNCPPTAAHLTARLQDIKGRKIEFDNCVFWVIGSNSEASRASRSGQYLLLDEVEKFDPGYVNVRSRMKARADGKVVNTSSPKDAGKGINALFKAGDREAYWVPCPHCGTYQVLTFGDGTGAGLRWEGGRSADPDLAERTAHYVCEKGCRIHDHHKPRMLLGGVWVPEKSTVAESIERERKAEEDKRYGLEPDPPTNASFRLSSLYSPFPGAGFGKMVREFVEKCGGRMTPYFVNDWLGEPWVVAGDRPEVEELERLCIPAVKGGYRLGEVPERVLALTMACDVQQDRIVVEVRGWGEGGEDTWLIDYEEVPRIKGQNLVELEGWLFPNGRPRAWRGLAGGDAGGRGFFPKVVAIDSSFFTDEVYAVCRRLKARGIRHIYAVKGDSQTGAMRGMWSESVPDQVKGMEPPANAFRLLVINSHHWKSALLGRIKGRAEVGEDGEMMPGGRGFYLPENTDGRLDRYLREMTSEQLVEDRGTEKRPKFLKHIWAMRSGVTDNHAWDACHYNLAAAARGGVRSLGRKEKGEKPAAEVEEVGPYGAAPWQR